MGPLLFILYINDIVNVSKDAELLLFADDTNVFLYDTYIYIYTNYRSVQIKHSQI